MITLVLLRRCSSCGKEWICNDECQIHKAGVNGCYCLNHYLKSFGKDADFYDLKQKGCPRFKIEPFQFR